ncbi:hypothetical protein JCM18899A_35810 [Nocardioides sp. AN3]
MSDPRVDSVGPDRLPSEAPTPYVGKRARRDVTPQVTLEPTAEPTQPYVGRRMARALDAAQVEETPAAPYVGRRVARPVVDRSPDLVLESRVPDIVDQIPAAVADRLPDTAEQATERAVAFVKPVAPVALLDSPGTVDWADWNLFAAESPEDTGQLPFALTEAFTGILPRIDGLPGTDFSYDTTTALPVVQAGKRARVPSRRPRLRLLPSLPALVGVAALAVAGFGALTAGKTDLVRAEAGPLHQASALSGTSGTGYVGDRGVSVSRGGGRAGAAAANPANSAAAARETALDAINKKATGRAQVLKKNQMQLPILPGAYHLTAGFGDYGLWAHLHTGLDFAAPTGTPIHAISNGVISSAQFDGAYGNKTVETLEDGTELWYCHQVQFNVTPGQQVHAGDVIGYVGSTGHVTGPHVHVEVRPGGGDPVDPKPWLIAHGLQP